MGQNIVLSLGAACKETDYFYAAFRETLHLQAGTILDTASTEIKQLIEANLFHSIVDERANFFERIAIERWKVDRLMCEF